MFAKFEKRQAAAGPTVVLPIAETPGQIVSDPLRRAKWIARGAVLVGLIVWTWQFGNEGTAGRSA